MKLSKSAELDLVWPFLAIVTIAWCGMLGQHYWWRAVLIGGLACAAFLIGCLIGFLFTSYGEETGTVGKVRDWVIGGLSGITLAKFGALKGVLLLFAASNSGADYALVVSAAIVYSALGFFFMFFQRELIFNVLLAESRAERGRIDGTHQATQITLELNSILSPSILAGVENVEELTDETQESPLRDCLYSDDVQTFLDQADSASKAGIALDWDVVSKVANLHYYRTYFEKDGKRDAELQIAKDWIVRSLLMNPYHMDLSGKYADVLVMLEQYKEAVIVLERLSNSSECPAYVEQWLGFYLLYLPGREDDAIRHSTIYLDRFPDSNEAVRNIASAYAQKCCARAKTRHEPLDTDSADYHHAIRELRRALEGNPGYIETMQTKWIQPGGSFECFQHDHQYRHIVRLDRHPHKKTEVIVLPPDPKEDAPIED